MRGVEQHINQNSVMEYYKVHEHELLNCKIILAESSDFIDPVKKQFIYLTCERGKPVLSLETEDGIVQKRTLSKTNSETVYCSMLDKLDEIVREKSSDSRGSKSRTETSSSNSRKRNKRRNR
jgi:hypothetical protein